MKALSEDDKNIIMKKIICVLLLFVVCGYAALGRERKVKIDGIKYIITSDSTVRVTYNRWLWDKSPSNYELENIIIPEKVMIRNKSYVVTEIGHMAFEEYYKDGSPHYIKTISLPKTIKRIGRDAFDHCEKLTNIVLPSSLEDIGCRAFSSCKSLKSMVIPNTVKAIGDEAFGYCSNLESMVIPDICPQQVESCRSDNSIAGIFYNSKNIQSIRGHNIPYPKWVFDHLESDVARRFQNTYTYYAYDRIKELIEIWQQKKEYETSAEWQQRVTEESRAQKLQEVKEQVRKEYIEKKAPKSVRYSIGSYDADYGVFPVTLNDMQPAFVQVPVSEAQTFKDNFKDVVITPTYGVIDDHLGVAAYTCVLDGKEYKSVQKHDDEQMDIAVNLPPLEISIDEAVPSQRPHSSVPMVTDNSIDRDIPTVSATNKQTFSVIIGNENYQKVSKVQFAQNDANTFAAYCQKTLGLPQKNVRIYKDATYATMLAAVKDIRNIADAYNGDINVIFYYAGHGIPNESNGSSYLLPIDVDGSQTEVCYPLDRLYSELGGLKAKCVTVFMDACFSGSERGNGMLVAARGVAIKAKASVPQGNMVVFSAATSEQTAYPYTEKGHGLFTYFLLKKLRETKGGCTLGELGDYVVEQVKRESVVSNGKPQVPFVTSSGLIGEGWKSMQLK